VQRKFHERILPCNRSEKLRLARFHIDIIDGGGRLVCVALAAWKWGKLQKQLQTWQLRLEELDAVKIIVEWQTVALQTGGPLQRTSP
jgi:hypothetical protein